MRTTMLAAGLTLLGLSASGSEGQHAQPAKTQGTKPAGTPATTSAIAMADRQVATHGMGKALELKTMYGVAPAEVKWGAAPPVLPPGAQMAVLEGDPMKENQHYTLRLKFPANYRVSPHYHPADERITVLSGAIEFNHGEKWSDSGFQSYGAGSFYALPGGMAHFARTRVPTELQISGVGPFKVFYFNPSDDPSRGTGGSGSEGK